MGSDLPALVRRMFVCKQMTGQSAQLLVAKGGCMSETAIFCA
ncbi:MAG: hypothetical protein ACLUO4_02725 [Christensenellales bacterium]